MEEMTFHEMESKVVDNSVCYLQSQAFRTALGHIERTNERLYRKLIEIEYNEAFG